MNEKFCQKHGPYDAHYATCPYCQRQGTRPSAPASLDKLVADAYDRHEELQTVPPRRGRRRDNYDRFDDVEMTQIPRRRRQRRRDEDDLDHTQVDRPKSGLLGWLIVKTGMRRGTIHRLGREMTIGRRQADIVVQDPKVSKVHAKFAIKNNHFVVADMLSENGTYVNGELIDQITVLRENDEIKVGDTELVLKTLEP